MFSFNFQLSILQSFFNYFLKGRIMNTLSNQANQTVETSAGGATNPVAPASPAAEPAACTPAPAGFEDFDLDDIEVIESKVFA